MMDALYLHCTEKLQQSSRLHENGQCLIWTGCVSRQGYGQFRYKDPRSTEHKTRTAHRVALMVKLKNFDISAQSQASHLCNNRLCINTEHIVLESGSTNCQRRTCFRMSKCNGHDDSSGCPAPECLVDLNIS